ncbi:hypothetical protein BDV12DRAFT_203919 [Aspergillus spectabilis]
MNCTASLLADTRYVNQNFFTRCRPKYYDISKSQIMDVKVIGAKGDGVTNDGPVLNAILQNAANLSSIVYFPFGVYVVWDTLKVPFGSRIIGQAWSQIMGKGSNFQNELEPRAVIKVGEPGNVGIVEIQDMLFTASGNTAGAVLMEWNVHESTQGSAGLWANIFLGMIQTESPYYQPVPKAPLPFMPGTFPDDPTFEDCPAVYLLGAGLYSWFSDYSQDYLETENCQQRGFHIKESNDIWIYNLCTKAIEEMITPVKELATLASDNRNGFLSSILAWIYPPGSSYIEDLTATCQTALSQTIKCHAKLQGWQQLTMRGSLENVTFTDELCDAGCGKSLRAYYEGVTAACHGQNLTVRAGVTFPERVGGTIWTSYNETCLKDPFTGEYCNGISALFPIVWLLASLSRGQAKIPC